MNNPFDRVNIGLRERPLSSDLNRMQSQIDRSLRDVLQSMLAGRTSDASHASAPASGFIGDGFMVKPTSPIGMFVVVSAGHGFVYDPADVPTNIGATDLENVDDRSTYKPIVLAAPHTFAVPAAPGVGQARIDIIEVRVNRRLADSTPRRQLDVTTKTFADHSFYKTLAFDVDGDVGTVSSPALSTAALSYKTGAAALAGAEVEPTTTPGYVKIGRVNVGASVTTIDITELVDHRKILGFGGSVPFSATWRVQWNAGTPIVTTLHIQAPPGVRLGFYANNAEKGSGTAVAIGGGITGASMLAGASAGNANNYHRMEAAGSYPMLDTVDGSGLGGFVPDVDSGKGQVYAEIVVSARFLIAGGQSNNSDASLDDFRVHVTGMLSYH